MKHTATASLLLLAIAGVACGSDEEEPGSGQAGMAGSGNQEGPDALDCSAAETLPADIDEDLTVGPGCVLLDRSVVGNDAVLTILPGTRLEVEAGGWLSVSRGLTAPDDGGTLLAQATEAEPILFTSHAAEPRPGDWGCVLLGSDQAASEFEHVIFEYGGAPCGASGNGYESELVVAGPTRTLTNSTARHSAGHGMLILNEAVMQSFSDNHFAENALPSLSVDANQLVSLGGGNRFDDTGDAIRVDGSGMNRGGRIVPQPVPYRFVGAATVGTAGAQPEITVEAGVRFELESDNFAVQAGNLIIDGSAEEPVVFTSSQATPAAGDWGCLWFYHGQASSQNTGTPTIRNAHIEYAGGASCGNNNDWPAALVVTRDAELSNLTFRQSSGHAILVALDECPATACDQDFSELGAEPLFCDGMPRTCP